MKNIKNVDIATIRRFPAMDFIGNDFAIFDNIGDIPLFGYSTRLNASCLTLCMKGYCKIRINLKEHELTEGVLVVTLPEQMCAPQSGTNGGCAGVLLFPSKEGKTERQSFP